MSRPQPSRRPWMLRTAAAACVLFLIVAAWRHWSRPPLEVRESRQFARQTATELSRQPSAPVTHPDEVARLFSSAPVHGESAPNEQVQQRLHELAAEFLRLRAGRDADEYSEWMRSRGWRIRDSATEWEDLDDDHIRYTGRPMPPDMTLEEFFRMAFESSLRRNRGEVAPAAVSGGPHGAECAYGVLTKSGGQIMDAFRGMTIDVKWIGDRSVGGRVHWTPPITIDQIIERDGAALVAELRFGCKAASGDWYPMRLLAYYDPAKQTWHISNLFYQNTHRISTGLEL